MVSHPLRVGVLAYQGSVVAHSEALRRCGAEPVPVKHEHDLEQLDGLILPGGESTTYLKLFHNFGLHTAVRRKLEDGLPAYGTCAGLILLAQRVIDGEPSPLGLMDITAHRNAYGRQVDSFGADLDIPVLGAPPFHGIFIRAPRITEVGSGGEVLASWNGEPVAVRQGHLLVSAFHPELTDDTRFHCYFLNEVIGQGRSDDGAKVR